MQNTAYPKATGGTPITSWIPNQIKAVLKAMHVLAGALAESPEWDKTTWQEGFDRKVKLLNKQLAIVAIDAFDPEAIFKLNLSHGLRDFWAKSTPWIVYFLMLSQSFLALIIVIFTALIVRLWSIKNHQA